MNLRTLLATMLLAGIAVTALAGSLGSLLEYYADSDMLRRISLWRMGGLDGANFERAALACAIGAVVLTALPRFAPALNALLLGDGSVDLTGYELGAERSLRDYEVYAGFDFRRKRAHPDVYTGRPPDPVTIRSEADWARCVTTEEFFEGNPERRPLASLEEGGAR